MLGKKDSPKEQESDFDTPVPLEEKQSAFFVTKNIVILTCSISTLIVIFGIGLYYLKQYQKNQELLSNPSYAAQKEKQSIIAKIGQLIELPTGEQPTIATVFAITKLQGQQSLQHTQHLSLSQWQSIMAP